MTIPPGADKDGLSQLAALVVKGKPQPEWLASGLDRAILVLRSNLHAESRHPSRVEMRKKLEALKQAAAAVVDGLDDDTIITALDGPEREGIKDVHAAWQSMAALIPRIDEALASIPGGKGRAKHHPQPVSTPLQMCAELVCVIWKQVHARPAPPSSTEAQDACEKLWDLADGYGRAHSSGDRTAKGWRDQIKAALGGLRQDGSRDERLAHLLRGKA